MTTLQSRDGSHKHAILVSLDYHCEFTGHAFLQNPRRPQLIYIAIVASESPSSKARNPNDAPVTLSIRRYGHAQQNAPCGTRNPNDGAYECCNQKTCFA